MFFLNLFFFVLSLIGLVIFSTKNILVLILFLEFLSLLIMGSLFMVMFMFQIFEISFLLVLMVLVSEAVIGLSSVASFSQLNLMSSMKESF